MGRKLRRSSRLVDMTQHLLEHPYKLIPLTLFAEQFGSAKSSISEDLSIIKELFEYKGSGLLKTVAGAAGGVKYIPLLKRELAETVVQEICVALEKSERLLPGGYLYMSDILGNPETLNKIGKIMATVFAEREIDVVMTVETKGIPLAYATANYLNTPVVIVRRDSKVTEGSVVSINYVSGSSKRIQTMSLARRVMPEKSKVLIIDDFMKAGGTARGMIDLLKEFNAKVVGLGVLAEAADVEERLIDDYVSLAKIAHLDARNREIKVNPGNFLSQMCH
ncbi:pur operon repressor [Ammoniphilus oxalaticus]|uniref:Pur operon repressor n=1 Tax=Ammoniphilus oxalaticus TaxID=66863 RepID=A0A419SG92_9BACL|nr:pur operon repressor [Ammoniphilus oxalaticus]RKD22804.1 pur operon repressor [Ammoniphilus oxalaticus]